MRCPASQEIQRAAYHSDVPSPPVSTVMPPGSPEDEVETQNQERNWIVEASPAIYPLPQPPTKYQKQSRRSRSRTPPEFWDNLSRVPLCRRALREFNRRIAQPVASKPPKQFALRGELAKQLKRFARHGGPHLHDIRGVGCIIFLQGIKLTHF